MVVQQVIAFAAESNEAKRERMRLNRENTRAFNGQQDWSHKIEGQSKEFLPKTAQTVEQFSAFIKKGLTQFGDWFTVDIPPGLPLSAQSVREIIKLFLNNLPDETSVTDFSTRLGDGTKVGLLESAMIFKVHGYHTEKRAYKVEDGKLKITKIEPWNLQIDLIPPNDYECDPSGKGLYEIHYVERDIWQLDQMSDEHGGPYRKEVLDLIKQDYAKSDDDKHENQKQQVANVNPAQNRKRVVLKEFWGSLLKPDGSVWMDRVLCTVANDKYLIRKPTPFPYWHQESCFVKISIMRVPFTVWHRALYDHVVPLNHALNELFNLMLDGGIASVWGIKQVRMDWLEDPRQISGGIPQGKTLVVKPDMPEGMKVVENVSEGEIPQDAMAMFGLLDREMNAAAMTNDIKLGNLPQKQTKATEIVESSQSINVLMDSIVTSIERGVENILRKAFLTILQNLNDVNAADLQSVLPSQELLALARMTPAERFATFANNATVQVHGLSTTLARARDFPKIMALLQVAQTSPLLGPVMMQKMSGTKLWDFLVKAMNLNPLKFEMDEEEKAQVPQRMAMFEQMMGMQNQKGDAAAKTPTGEAGLQSEIHQNQMGTGGL